MMTTESLVRFAFQKSFDRQATGLYLQDMGELDPFDVEGSFRRFIKKHEIKGPIYEMIGLYSRQLRNEALKAQEALYRRTGLYHYGGEPVFDLHSVDYQKIVLFGGFECLTSSLRPAQVCSV